MNPRPAGDGQSERLVVVGRIEGAFGLAGWVRVSSHTRPRDNLLAYDPWYVEDGDAWRQVRIAQTRNAPGKLFARIEGVEDRDAARALAGCGIAVQRGQFGPALPGEYYWFDLIGLQVLDLAGRELGRVTGLRETGANDVLVVEGDEKRLIPFIADRVVREVDLDRGTMRVDWNTEYF
jgi:16S rRNA processing protein RimM